MFKTIFDPSKQNQDTCISQESIEKKIVRLQHRIHIVSKKGQKRNTRNLQRLLVHTVSKHFGIEKTAKYKAKIWISKKELPKKLEMSHETKKNSHNEVKYSRYLTPSNKKKVHQMIWNLALIPAITETCEQECDKFENYKSSNVTHYHKLLNKIKKSVNAKWILKIESQKLFDDVPLKWMLKNTPLEKSILYYYLKSVKENSKNRDIKDNAYKNKEILSSVKKHILETSKKLIELQATKNKNTQIKFEIASDNNEVNIFSKSKEELLALCNKLVGFFNLDSLKNHLKIRSTSKQLKIFEWTLYKLKNKITINLSKENLKNHKENLRTIIKSSTKVSTLLTKINALHKQWQFFNRKINNFQKTLQEINVYLFKLLWHWAQRQHSNKGKLWIFHNYWKKIKGKWKFTTKSTTKIFPNT